MTGRLAARNADAEALLARFNEASESALEALGRGDGDALARALDVRDALQHEIDRASRELRDVRARFMPAGTASAVNRRVADLAMAQYCAPLEELARAAQALQERLETTARTARAGVLAELASLETAAGAAVRYATNDAGDPHRLDVRL